MKKLTNYKNGDGEPVTEIVAVRIFGNDTGRHIVDQNGKRITALERIPMSELAELARDAPIWMGDHGPIHPPISIPPEVLAQLKAQSSKTNRDSTKP